MNPALALKNPRHPAIRIETICFLPEELCLPKEKVFYLLSGSILRRGIVLLFSSPARFPHSNHFLL